jgi:hypothetical protein
MIFAKKPGNLAWLGITHATHLRRGVGSTELGALRAGPERVCVTPDQVCLTRSFRLVTHAGSRDARLERLTTLLRDGMRVEIARLQSLVG